VIALDDLFSLATSIAKGNIIQQQFGDKMQPITPKERQMWAQIAAKIGMVMSNLSRGFDKREFNENLQELDRLVTEIEKLNDKDIAKARPAWQTQGP
jgi:hypothetical protein